jgi:hypothetical protein
MPDAGCLLIIVNTEGSWPRCAGSKCVAGHAPRLAFQQVERRRVQWFSSPPYQGKHGRFIVIERFILGAFLVLPLLIVAFLFSDELWQEHRKQIRAESHRRVDWRHPLRSLLHRH